MEITSSAPSEGNSDSQNADLDGLIDYISKFVERSEKRNSSRSPYFLGFGDSILNKYLPKYMDVFRKRFAESLMDTSIFGAVPENKKEALRLLKVILLMTEWVKSCRENPQLKERMQLEIKNANKLIIEGYKTCCAQIESPLFERFFRAADNKHKLRDIREKLNHMNVRFSAQMGVNVLYAIDCEVRPSLHRDFPNHAVGLEESVKEVIDALELESENKALAVVLHGVRGMGKTTLAKAVFSNASLQEWKCSRIELFDNRESIPNITDLQRLVLKDLTESRKIAEIRNPEEGQRELANILRKVPAFIYIDNVVREDELRQLLPEDLNNAKKVRLLIIARNVIVGRACPLNRRPKEYPMKGMSRVWAEMLFNGKLFDDMKGKLNREQLDHILDICDGNPLMLIKVAKALCFDEDKRSIFVLQSKNSRLVVEGGKNKEKIEGS